MNGDDTHLTYADNDIFSIEASLNQDLSNINSSVQFILFAFINYNYSYSKNHAFGNHWLIANKLTLNMTKTEFMLIGSRQKLNSLSALPALEINGTQLLLLLRNYLCLMYFTMFK